jgi:hypothetical protein
MRIKLEKIPKHMLGRLPVGEGHHFLIMLWREHISGALVVPLKGATKIEGYIFRVC